MLPSKTKQISVYGKRPRRVIDAPSTENPVSDINKPDRVPLIHRMKKRENGPAASKSAVRSKHTSPPRALLLTKQRVVPNGSPARKGVKRGTRLAEILGQETTKRSGSGFGEDYDVGGKKSVPGTPARMPLSTITTNAMNSPVASNVRIAVKAPKKQKEGSPRSLVTSKTLSTVQIDIKVLDAKGQTVKQEKRVAKKDVVVNGGGKPSRKYEIVAVRSPRQNVPAPVEVISICSSADEPLIPGTHGTSSSPPVLSSGSSAAINAVRAVRKPRRAFAQIVISDDDDDDDELEEESDHEDTYLPPDSPPPPVAKSLRESLSRPRRSMAPQTKVAAPVLTIPKPSGLRVEVVIPPAPYKVQPQPAPQPSSPPKNTQSRSNPTRQDRPQLSPILPAKSLRTSSSGTTEQEFIPSRYPFTSSYNVIPSPPLKARELTPIRRGQNKTSAMFAYGRGAPPASPTTPTDTDFDLSLEFSQLDIGIPREELEALRLQEHHSQIDYPHYLKPLLKECHQEECGPYEFSAFIESFPLDPILQDARDTSRRRKSGETLRFRKIGEASYSEVFGIGDVVLKVVPLRDESRRSGVDEEEEDGPAPTDARDVRKEIIVTRAMGEVHDGFVKLLKTYVVRGKYPEVLLNLWDDYEEKKGSESVRPDTFTASQTYAIIVLPNDGPDLEAYTFSNTTKTGWRKASSLFWQVAKALAHAEQLVSFEHRDLHWGQILVKDLQPSNKPAPLRSLTHTLNQNGNKGPRMSSTRTERVFMDDLDHGVQATIIDLGLSRMDAGDGEDGNDVHWTPFDDEVFLGEGDYQFDIYRSMKEYTAGNWEAYHPLTNVMWLHYLVTKLLRHKNLKAPSVPRKPRPTSTTTPGPIDPSLILRNIKPSFVNPPPLNAQLTEKDCYDALVGIEEWLGKCIAEAFPLVVQKPKGRERPRKTITVVPTQGKTGGASALMCSCARQVVGYGVKRGWIRPVSDFSSV